MTDAKTSMRTYGFIDRYTTACGFLNLNMYTKIINYIKANCTLNRIKL